jgi:membrane protease YdiL (CAAX protease family)
VCLGVTGLVVACSYLLSSEWAGTAVGLCFLVATSELVLRGATNDQVRHYGLSFGGLLESEPLEARRIIVDTLVALAWCLGAALIVFPPFVVGFLAWWQPAAAFAPAALSTLTNDAAGQLLVVALPEEAFYRGYLQTALDDAWPKRWKFLGGHLSPGVLVASLLFALGHLLTEPNPTRLAVFFPSLLFGWLRTRTRGVGAGIGFHALSNLFSAYLGRCFGMWS